MSLYSYSGAELLSHSEMPSWERVKRRAAAAPRAPAAGGETIKN